MYLFLIHQSMQLFTLYKKKSIDPSVNRKINNLGVYCDMNKLIISFHTINFTELRPEFATRARAHTDYQATLRKYMI